MRPILPRQNGFKSAYIIGAVRPGTGDKHALLFDGLDARVMSIYLEDFSRALPKHVHALMDVDGAGWHSADDRVVPKNVTLLQLPPYSPELNPIEQIWAYLKSNFLSGRIYNGIDDIFDQGTRAWRQLTKKVVKSICAGAAII